MTSSAVASKLIFLADLPTCQTGDKIRFLGCIHSHDIVTGTLAFRHDYKGSKHVAKVTIQQGIQDTLANGATTPGNWITVVGYVVRNQETTEMVVQATMLWEAGPMKIEDYERALQARKDNTLPAR